jgi:hypothetical protein
VEIGVLRDDFDAVEARELVARAVDAGVANAARFNRMGAREASYALADAARTPRAEKDPLRGFLGRPGRPRKNPL